MTKWLQSGAGRAGRGELRVRARPLRSARGVRFAPHARGAARVCRRGPFGTRGTITCIEMTWEMSRWQSTYQVSTAHTGLVFKDHRLLYYAALGLRVIEKKKKKIQRQ